jgi:lipoprotein-anchoring transpeptidase ErfK/SrfK
MTARIGAATAATVLVTCVLAAGGAVASATRHRGLAVRPTQTLAALLRAEPVYTSFRPGRSRETTISAKRPITGEQTVLPVVARAKTRYGTRWLQVMVPGRPNGRRGWITQQGTVLTETVWHLVVSIAGRRIFVYKHGLLIRSYSAIVGKPSTPTPPGQFFVEEDVTMRPGAPGAPFALALSARSDALRTFNGGPGQIAIHGLENLGGTLGTAESHGCVRLSTPAITWLIDRIAPGTPVTITGHWSAGSRTGQSTKPAEADSRLPGDAGTRRSGS